MGRPKGSKNKNQSGICYPRKCDHCDYVSNNPSMYHYHKKIHDPIPAGQLCHYGCGNFAEFKNTHGRYSCKKIVHHCPEYLRKHSERVEEQWQRPEAIQRKEEARLTIESRLNTKENIEKRKQTLKEKWGNFTPEQLKDYRHYARRVRTRAQKWAKDQGYELGQQTYHVDHILSIWDAYAAGLSEEIVNHPANLQIIEAKKNTSKGATSYFTVEELLEKIKLYEPR